MKVRSLFLSWTRSCGSVCVISAHHRNTYGWDTLPHVMQERSPFSALGLGPLLVRAVEGLGYETPPPTQPEATPPIPLGLHVIGTAQTGAGTTAASGLPIL